MGCCGDDKNGPETYRGGPKRDGSDPDGRSCTDCHCLIIFLLFWIGFVIVMIIGFQNGDPDRLLYGTDYLGYVCGRTGFNGGEGPPEFNTVFDGSSPTSLSPWQSTNWSENKFLWYPVAANVNTSDPNFSVFDILDNGVCVKTCPYLPTNISDMLNFDSLSTLLDFEDVFDYMTGQESNPTDDAKAEMTKYFKVFTYGSLTRLNTTSLQPDHRTVLYNAEEFYRRCYPGMNNSATVNATLEKIPGAAGVSNFLFVGVAEMRNSWIVFIIAAVLCIILCFIYTTLMKWAVVPLTWISILLCFMGLIALGILGIYQRKKVIDVQETLEKPDEELEKMEKLWLAVAIIGFIAAIIFAIVICFFRKSIQEATNIIRVAGRVIRASWSLILWPWVIGIAIVGIFMWCMFVGVYLYTSDSFTDGAPEPVAVPFNQTSFLSPNSLWYVDPADNLSYVNTTTRHLDSDSTKRNLMFYDLFAFLWTAGFLSAIGFMVISFHGVVWYFSSTKDDEKEIPVGTFPKVLCWTVFYHTGTLAFGSFLVALIQFLRCLLYYFEKTCKQAQESEAAKCMIKCAHCFLAYMERVIKIINKNAYIVCCITNEWFICAAKRGIELLMANAAAAFVMGILIEVITFIGKALVVVVCLIVSWLLMDYDSIAPEVTVKFFPLFWIGVMCYLVCCVFFAIYTTTVDTIFLCYHYDRDVNAAQQLYYVPAELAELIHNYDAEKANAQFDAVQAQATAEAKK